jgi:hypothetical protein
MQNKTTQRKQKKVDCDLKQAKSQYLLTSLPNIAPLSIQMKWVSRFGIYSGFIFYVCYALQKLVHFYVNKFCLRNIF